MKFRTVSLALSLLAAICITNVAQAQIQLNVPFRFSVGKQSLPAGRYKVMRVHEYDQGAWLIFNQHGGVFTLTNPAGSTEKRHRPSLVFLQTGDGYSLMQIWSSEYSGQDLILKPKVTTVIVAHGGKYVEIGAE
jgi:hypothetical protein